MHEKMPKEIETTFCRFRVSVETHFIRSENGWSFFSEIITEIKTGKKNLKTTQDIKLLEKNRLAWS
jgi:hypothetical protein